MVADWTVGSAVEWTSQSGGYKSTKRGVIVAVVPAGVLPGDIHRVNRSIYQSGVRDHDSYLVRARQVGKARGRAIYWPRVTHLRPATEEPK